MNFIELFEFCKKNRVGISVRCQHTEYDVKYYLRLRRGDHVVEQIFDGSTLDLLRDPAEMINDRIEESINELDSKSE